MCSYRQVYLDCLEMLVEVVSVVLRAPRDSTSEDSRDRSVLVSMSVLNEKEKNETDSKDDQSVYESVKKVFTFQFCSFTIFLNIVLLYSDNTSSELNNHSYRGKDFSTIVAHLLDRS